MNKVDFDALSKAAYAEKSKIQEKDALWLEVFSLPEWYFIATGTLPNIVPYIGRAEVIEPGSLWLYAFTDANRASTFAKENGFGSQDGSTFYLTVPNNRTIVRWIMGYKDNDVKGIFFNADGNGFYAPIRQLKPIKDHLATAYPDRIQADE
ncbi:MAG: hypothetical protein R2780_00320 [Crocinitomicaceae bacterium]|nr:hypothetical protein [Crocinitomicaceae bacterium]